MDRFSRLQPPPRGRLPILIGGSGEKVTLRLVAEHADMWNSFGPAETYAHKNRVLDEWCKRVDRKPSQVERTVAINGREVENVQDYLDAQAEHVIVMLGPPFDMGPVRALLRHADA
jgi:alkanesulfonate monooxygenase SsuD/methylene tetrahydromethanopterin reductase-like flavin-dependent oxidoreductase (luciferase family)